MTDDQYRRAEGGGFTPYPQASPPPPDPSPFTPTRGRSAKLSITLGLTAVALTGAVLYGTGVLGGPSEDEQASGSAGASSEGSTEQSTPEAPAEEAETAPTSPDLDDPYQGTAAMAWQEGTAGLVLPEPGPVGDHSAEAVAAVVDQVSAFIELSRVDPRSLTEHDAEAVLELLAPDSRPWVRDYLEDPATSLAVQTRVSPDHPLLPVEPRMDGTLSVEQGPEGMLEVRADYIVAYAFEPDPEHAFTLGAASTDFVVFDRTEQVFVLVEGELVPPNSSGLWLEEFVGYTYNVSCDSYEEGFLAPGWADERFTWSAGDDADMSGMFDADDPMPTAESTC